MATVTTFNNKNIIEPGVYSQIRAETSLQSENLSTGNILIIDTGEGIGYGGGSGINGELLQGANSIYSFDRLTDFRSFVRGGILWDLAEYIYNPINNYGAQRVLLIRAATTVSAKGEYNFIDAGNGGVFSFKCKTEGAEGNGTSATATDTVIRTGYGALLKRGVNDNTKFFIEFYEGTYKGKDAQGNIFNGQEILKSEPILISKSIEFNNINDLIDWAKNDSNFYARFELDLTKTKVEGTGVVSNNAFTSNDVLLKCSGGMTDYNTADYDKVLDTIENVDFSLVLSLKHGNDAKGVENTKLLHQITKESEFKKIMIVGGGNDSLSFNQVNGSIDIAKYFDSPYVIVCHSGFKVDEAFTNVEKSKTSLYFASMVSGVISGLAPQTSLTFKKLKIKNWNHQLTKNERELALQSGVLHIRFVDNIGNVINQGINTLQKNTQMINQDGTSSEISIIRIAEQLNKELTLNMRPIFTGKNLNTTSPADIKSFIEGYLLNKTATETEDNLIIRFENVTITQVQDYYDIKYGFVPNSPVNKMFITGFMLDSNLTV